MLFTDIIGKKRDGEELSAEEITFFVAGLADGSIPREQVAALAMAVCLNSMSAAEAGRLTMDMAASGTTLQWQDENLDGPVVDKLFAGAHCRCLWLLRTDDFGPRPWTYWWHN